MIQKLILIFCISALSAVSGHAQSIVLPLPSVGDTSRFCNPEPEISRINSFGFSPNGLQPVKNLGEEQGLPSVDYYTVFADSRGNIWMGLQFGGIARFDGSKLEYFSEFEFFNSSKVLDIIEDQQGRIWFASQGKGIMRYNGHCFEHFSQANGLPDNYVLCLFEDRKGRVWAGTNGSGVFRFDQDSLRVFTVDDGLPVNKVWSIEQDNLDRIWFGTIRSGIAVWDEIGMQRFRQEDGFNSNNIRSLFCDQQGIIWIGTDMGISRYINGRFEIYKSSENEEGMVISDICGRSNGDIFFGVAEQGLLRLRNEQIEIINTENGLIDLSISSICPDEKDNIWIASLGGGIMRYDAEIFRNYNQVETFGSGISSIYVDNDGNATIGLNSGKLSCFGDLNNCFEKSPSLSAPIFDIDKDNSGNFWIAADNEGLWYQKNGQWQKQNIALAPKARFITVTATDNAIYAGTFSDGIFKITPDTVIQFIPENLKGKDIWAIFEDREGRIWLGTDKADLWLLNPSGDSGMQIGKKEGLPGNLVYSICEDKNGNLWIGLKDRGIAMLKAEAADNCRNAIKPKPEDFLRFTSADILISNLADLVYCDNKNHLWVGTSKGIQRFDISNDLQNPLSNPRHYGLHEGLRGVQANTRKVFEDGDGNIWWGMSKYLCIYQPAEDSEDSGLPLVFLDGLQLAPGEKMRWNDLNSDNRFYPIASYLASIWRNYIHFDAVSPWNGMPEKLVLSHNLNRLIFQYHAINWKGEDKVRYQIMLQGLDNDWRDAGSTDGMEYPSLPPGKYSFKVRASNEAGLWSEPAVFEFIIQEPFWQTTWFISLVIILLIAATYLFFRYRLKRLQKENLILEVKVKERTEDLRKEKLKSDNLLLNILPEKTAEELKERGAATTRNYASASVLFSDFKGFTMLTETITSGELINTLDSFFKEFDEAIPIYKVEKIKTIGDAYMCAAGIPVEDPDHAVNLVGFALEMLSRTKKLNTQRAEAGLTPWNLRIGIHSGSLISGVVGKRKFAYDIWGDTVNIAARMESSGEVSKLNISESTYQLVKDHFICESRGKIAAKNKGELEMYFVLGRK